MTISFNGQDYIPVYNAQTGYYELELTAPTTGGIYNAEISFTDLFGQSYTDTKAIQIWAKEQIKIETNKVFMWIFDYKSGSTLDVKDIVEIADFEINIDEETNARSYVNVLKKTTAKAKDIVAIKRNNEVIYWGIIDEIQNENGKKLNQYILKHITNLFNRTIRLLNENIIRENGVEDFVSSTINTFFTNNSDTFTNILWLTTNVVTHTPKQTSVTNVENNIYNFHNWIINCTQKYDIVYSFSIVNKKLLMTIENKTYSKELIDVKAQSISNYTEVFETDVVAKVIVLYDKKNGAENSGIYSLYLKADRTTTTDASDSNRADGNVTTVYTENYEDANQKALDVMKANSYNHNITFNYYDRMIKVGTPIAIKTKESIIYDTYISASKITPKKFIEYTCGNIRVKFIDKILQERNK